MPDRGKIELVFFSTAGGSEPVREWLKEQPPEDRLIIGQDLQRLQYRWPIGMPLARSLGDGLWEVRSSLPNGRIARVLFCFDEGVLVALHGFIKKTQKTPKAELGLALARKKELEQ
jgi:phage-related protein